MHIRSNRIGTVNANDVFPEDSGSAQLLILKWTSWS